FPIQCLRKAPRVQLHLLRSSPLISQHQVLHPRRAILTQDCKCTQPYKSCQRYSQIYSPLISKQNR
ncbi:hypothetical protein GALMADRAFT_272541, partial [Galerina marginata CBS 339.88]